MRRIGYRRRQRSEADEDPNRRDLAASRQPETPRPVAMRRPSNAKVVSGPRLEGEKARPKGWEKW